MDSYLYLFFHVFSHMLFGAAIAYCLLPRKTWKERVVTLFSGALCGIIPDLFGDRTVNPLSHSIFFSPILVILIALLTKYFHKTTTFKWIWGSSILSLIVGHLLLDLMDHDMPLLYPISDHSFMAGAVTLGDPWIWLPLFLGLAWSLCLRGKPKSPVIISILFVILYLIFRMTAKEIIEEKVHMEYPSSEKSYIVVEPDTYYEYSFNPSKWLEFRFQIISAHFARAGQAGLLGEKSDELFFYDFYPVAREINLVNGKYTVHGTSESRERFFSVTDEWTEAGVQYVKGKKDGQFHTFKKTPDGQWEEALYESQK